MATQNFSIGDILMLSQQAWNLSRAFAPGDNTAPSEFANVEQEANDLSRSLKSMAEHLQSDGSVLSRVDPGISTAVNGIIQSAGSTLADLEAFVDSYQVIRKRETAGGFVVGRTWIESVVEDVDTTKWSTGGANLVQVSTLLHLHAESMHLTSEALQSRSPETLESVVFPLAELVARIHKPTGGSLRVRIDGIRRQMAFLAGGGPVDDESRAGASRQSERSLEVDSDRLSGLHLIDSVPAPSCEHPSLHTSDTRPHDSAHPTPAMTMPSGHRPDSPSLGVIRRTPSQRDKRAEQHMKYGNPETKLHVRGSSITRRESTTLPRSPPLTSIADEDVEQTVSHRSASRRHGPHASQSRREPHTLSTDDSILPPPLLPATSQEDDAVTPATPSSLSNIPKRSRGDSAATRPSPRPGTAKSTASNTAPGSPPLLSLPNFKQQLFRNAAILCDVRGRLVEYARKIPDELDPRYDTEMVEACQECRVSVVRKREHRPHGGTRVSTSIWIISKDGVVRAQQRLSDYVETVPYCSHFEQEKVSIPPTAGEKMSLEFHGEHWGDELEQQVQTNWVNYFLSTEQDAQAFQSAVYGRLLTATFRTLKTTVIHDGLLGTFAFEEQFANIETLRLFQDDGVATPGAEGGVLALMHISSNFGEGWARWWMNCSRQQVRVKADGAKHARLKGIDISVVKPGQMVTAGDKLRNMSTRGELQRMDTESLAKSAGKRVPVKRVTGVRIEFQDGEERDRFVDASRLLQTRMIPLPPLGGGGA